MGGYRVYIGEIHGICMHHPTTDRKTRARSLCHGNVVRLFDYIVICSDSLPSSQHSLARPTERQGLDRYVTVMLCSPDNAFPIPWLVNFILIPRWEEELWRRSSSRSWSCSSSCRCDFVCLDDDDCDGDGDCGCVLARAVLAASLSLRMRSMFRTWYNKRVRK